MASSTGRPIRVVTLGRLAITVGGELQPALPNQRLRCALLVYLAVMRECSRDSLVAVFWPERSSESARHALSQNLYELRRTLGEAWLETSGDALRATDLLSCDVAIFEAAADAGRLDTALELYGGPFLDGTYLASSHEFEDWVERHRARFGRLHRRARRTWVERRIAAGDHAAALGVAAAAVAADSFDDEMQHQLIALLAATGDRNAALDQYARYEEALKQDGLVPLDDTARLVASIRDASADVVGPPPSRFAPPAEQAAYVARAPTAAQASAGDAATGKDASPSDGDPAGTGALPIAPERQDQQPAAALPEQRTAPAAAALPHRFSRGRLAALVAVTVAGAMFLLWAAARLELGGRFAAEPRAAGENALTGQRLAVLPFENAGTSGSLDYLAAQLPVALIHQLRTDAPTLPVVSHYGVLRFAGANVPLDSVARALGATLLVGGSVIHSAEGATVRVQLIDGATGDVLRAAEVHRTGEEPLALISDVVREVTVFLRGVLGHELRMRGWRAGTTSDVAFDLFGRGELHRRHWLASARSPDSPAISQGLSIADSLFAAAERADPAWPDPPLYRARVAEHRAFYALTRREPAHAFFDEALRHVNRALQVRGDHAAALEERAALNYLIWQTLPPDQQLERTDLLAAAETDLNAAIAVDASLASAWSRLSALYFTRGEYELAYTAADRGYRVDHFFDDAFTLLDRLTRAAFEVRQDDIARERCREGQRRFPDQAPFLACDLLLGGWGRHGALAADSAWALARRLIELAPRPLASHYQPTNHALVAANLAAAGQIDSAYAVLAAAEAWPDRDPQFLPTAAGVHLILGDPETAMRLIRTFVDEQPVLAWQLLRGRVFEPLRDNAEFRRLAGIARN